MIINNQVGTKESHILPKQTTMLTDQTFLVTTGKNFCENRVQR